MATKIKIVELDIDEKAFLKAAEATKIAIDKIVLSQKKLEAQGKKNSQEFIKNEANLKKLSAEFLNQKKAIIALESPYARLSNKLIRSRKEAKDLAVEFGVNSRQARKAAASVNDLDKKLKKIDSSVGQNQRRVGKYSDALRGLSARFLGVTALISGLVLGFKEAFNIVKTFEKANATLSGILQVERDDMRDLEREAERLGATTVKTATQVTELQIAFARLGFTQEEIIDLTEATINGSIAMNSELSETANLVGAVVNTFDELSATDAPDIIDIMSLATAKSALNFEQLKTAIPNVAGAANAAGIPFTTLTALLGKLADSGIDASKSSTALRNIFIESAAQGLNYEQIIEKIKGSTDKLTASNDEFGKRSAVSATVLAQNIDATKKLDLALQGAAGTAERMAEKELNTLDGSVKLLTSAWQGFVLSIEKGTGIFGSAVRGIIDFTASLLGALTPTDSLSSKFFDLKENIEDLETEMTPLLDRYDELKEKSKLSTEEQTELSTILNKIGKDMPSVITEFDKYGVALGVSTDAARDFIEEQKNILKLQNKDAIKEEEEAIESLTLRFNTHALSLEKQNGEFVKIIRSYTKIGTEVRTAIRLTDEEIVSRNKARAAISTEIDTRNAIIARLKGERTEKEKLAAIDEVTEEIKTKPVLSKKEEKEADKQKEQALKDEQTFQDELLEVKNRAAIRELESKSAQDKLKIDQDLKAKKLEIDALKVSEKEKNTLKSDLDKEAKSKKDEIDLQNIQIFENKKRELQNKIDLENAATDEEKALLKQEQALEKQILDLEKLQLTNDETQELKRLLETQNLQAIEDIKEEFRNTDAENTQALEDKKKGIRDKAFNDAVKLVGSETRLGKALLAVKQIISLKEQILSARSVANNAKASVTNATIKGAEATADIATGAAKTASSAPFPANIPLILGYAIQAVGIISAVKSAISATKSAGSNFYEGGQVGVPQGTGGVITGSNIPTQTGGDNILATVKSGEVILNDQQQARAGGSAFFKSIGVPGFQTGGQAGVTSNVTNVGQQSALNIDSLSDAIASKINDIKIVAIESEITDAQTIQVEITDGANI